jgi:hypothetical protein
MIENKDEVLQAIKKVANDNGYDFSYKACESRVHEEVLNLTVQPKDGDDRRALSLVVAKGENRFRVTFAGADISKHCKDLDQLLIIIKDWLLNRKD